MKICAYILAAVACAGVVCAGAARAGVVQTADGRLEGAVTFADGRVEVGGKAAPWESVIYAMPQCAARPLSAGGAVRLRGGEVWQADIVSLAAKRLVVRLPQFGRREIDVAGVSALEFVPGLAPAQGMADGTLYREKGEPVPGALLWVDEGRLALDSALGAVTLPREGIVRYVFARARAAAATAGDEVGLADGSILRGRATPAAGAVRLEHPVLGTVSIGADQVRFVVRRGGCAADLTELEPESVAAPGLLGGAAQAATVERRRAGDGGTGKAACLASMTVQAKTVLRYRVPQELGRNVRLSARVGPVEGARGDVRVRIAAGTSAVFEREFAPGATPADVRVDLPAGAGAIELTVDFGSRIGFPCGASVEDPLLISVGGRAG